MFRGSAPCYHHSFRTLYQNKRGQFLFHISASALRCIVLDIFFVLNIWIRGKCALLNVPFLDDNTTHKYSQNNSITYKNIRNVSEKVVSSFHPLRSFLHKILSRVPFSTNDSSQTVGEDARAKHSSILRLWVLFGLMTKRFGESMVYSEKKGKCEFIVFLPEFRGKLFHNFQARHSFVFWVMYPRRKRKES